MAESLLSNWKRSHYIGDLDASLKGQEITLMGWVHKRRDLGQVVFIDLRDRYGRAQIVFDPAVAQKPMEVTKHLRNECVIAVRGTVAMRPEGQANKKMATGEIEVHVTEAKILNIAEPLPFQINEAEVDATEALKLRHRYLEMRRDDLKNNILARGKVSSLARVALEKQGFIDIETPVLYKSTPEGAREFLVPSRIHPGNFYALPQSPQLFKQVLMVAGMDRYYQIVKCFRDEDLRADRQPEFTQIDCEMSFVEQEDVLETFETVVKDIVEGFTGNRPDDFPRMTYKKAMDDYGVDKPDLRFEMTLKDLGSTVAGTSFKVFADALSQNGIVNALVVEGQAEAYSRKKIDELTEIAKKYGARGLAWAKVQEGGTWQSPIAKFFDEKAQAEINAQANAKAGDLILFGAGDYMTTKTVLGALRNHLGKELDLIPENMLSTLWVVEFPSFEQDDETGRYVACHHPFTMPLPEDIDKLETDPGNVRACAYDLVINGYEIGGGSIRIHDPEVQSRQFKAIGISDQEAEEKFGFLLDALKYGAPPHGGIAFGLDRLVMVLLGLDSIKDVIPFPKTNKAACLMTHSPNLVSDKELQDLHIKSDVKERS